MGERVTLRRPLALGAAATIGFASLFAASPAFANGSETPPVEQQAEAPISETPAEGTPTETESKTPEESAPEATTPEASTPEDSSDGEQPKAKPGISEWMKKAPAEAKPDTEASSPEAEQLLFEAKALEAANVTVVALGPNSKGEKVLLTTPDSVEFAEAAVERIDADIDIVEVSAPLEAYAKTDVVGGAGYLSLPPDFETSNRVSLCSIGFAAWDAAGKPALLSAGHCTGDDANTDVTLTQPSKDTAGGGTGGVAPLHEVGDLGEFSFSQYGGPGHTKGADGSLSSTDVAIIEGLDSSLKTKPEVTRWTTSGSEDLAADTIKITSTGKPKPGSIAKSGRTTGYTTGSIRDKDIIDGWALISDRWVYGFSSDVKSTQGDSGGSIFQGNTAVGILSGGNDEITWGADLKNALAQPGTSGYAVQLHIDAPAAPTTTTVGESAQVTAAAPAGATRILLSQGQGGGEIPVTNGTWSFPAPDTAGSYTFKAVAANAGFDRSATTTFTLTVTEAELAAPVITSASEQVASLTEITGTGVAGATIDLSVNNAIVSPLPVVAADGTWKHTLDTPYGVGMYDVVAVQSMDDEISPSAQKTITVRPAVPTVSSVSDGDSFAAGQGPSKISGGAAAGALVTLTIAGKDMTATADVSGNWTVDLGAALGEGEYRLSVIQSLNEIDSAARTLGFTVQAAEVPAPGGNTPPPGNGDKPGGGGGTGLPVTGGDDLMLPLAAGAGGLALLGGAALLMARRKRANV